MMYLHVVWARRTFLGAHLMVDVQNNFQSRSHVTEFTGEVEQKPELLADPGLPHTDFPKKET